MPTKTKPEDVVMDTKEAVMEANGKERNPVLEASRKLFLAGVGAVALTQEKVEELFGKLVERGETVEKDGRKAFGDAVDRRKKTTHTAEEKMSKQVEEILDRLNVPTKGDIETLSDKIGTLTKKVDELKKEKIPA